MNRLATDEPVPEPEMYELDEETPAPAPETAVMTVQPDPGSRRRESRSLRRRTLAAEVAETLRDMVLIGELPGGARMTQEELAQLLGVSTMPVREALLRLAAEGFVEVSQNRSFSVVETTREDINDVFWIYATLAGELTRRAVQKGDDLLVATLREYEDQFVDAKRSGDAARMGRVNWEFHRAINAAAESPKLLRVLRSTLRFIPQGFYVLVPEWAGVSVHGHEAIIAAFTKRDPEAAREAAETHVREAGETLLRFFTNSGYWTRPDGSE